MLVWGALCLGLVPVIVVVAVQSYVAVRAQLISAELERRTVAWERSGFSRPVLRGVARPGNADVAHFKAVVKIGQTYSDLMDWSKDAQDAIRSGAPRADLLALARVKSEGLAELRAATQHTQVRKPQDVRSGRIASPPYLKSWRVLLLLLALASREPGDECLRIAADGLRTMWDVAPSGGNFGQGFGDIAAKIVLPFATTCLRRARPCDLAPAAAEFREILRCAPTLGDANYADYLSAAWLVNRLSGGKAAFVDVVLARHLLADERRTAIAMQRIRLGAADLFRGITPDRYPSIWQEITGRVDRLPAGFHKEQLEELLKELGRWVKRDQEAQAIMRAMVLGLGLLGGDPDALAGDPLLRDPFSGAPLLWRRATVAAPAVVYSVGPNGKDDDFATGSDDVGLTFPAIGQDPGPWGWN